MYRSHVLICGGTGCTSSNSEKIIEKMKEEIKARGLENEVNVVRTGCFGLCALGPIMIVYPEGAFYSMVKVEDVPEIVEEHLLKGRIVKRLLYQETVQKDDTIKSLNETAFYAKQRRIALRNCGVINPENIDEYIAQDGYAALGKVLTEMTPEQVIQVIKDSGLRGRGGAGFPTGVKWSLAAGNKADQKYVCCNADEGDPGAFMDRSVLEGDPHCVLEAMAIAGYAIGATKGYIYVRAEYPIAVKRLEIAIGQAREYGLLGKNIFDSGFDFDIQLRLGAGAFVCGEETALMTSIEGKRGEPRPRPPYPAVKGLFGKPAQMVFEMDVKDVQDDRFELEFHYCPLVKAWQKQGCTDEEISNLCDWAMCGDRGIGEAYGYSLCRYCGNGQAYRNAEAGEQKRKQHSCEALCYGYTEAGSNRKAEQLQHFQQQAFRQCGQTYARTDCEADSCTHRSSDS